MNETKLFIKFFLEEKDILSSAKIHKIIVKRKKVIIYVERPGLLIGKAGSTYEELKKKIKKDIVINEFDPFRD